MTSPMGANPSVMLATPPPPPPTGTTVGVGTQPNPPLTQPPPPPPVTEEGEGVTGAEGEANCVPLAPHLSKLINKRLTCYGLGFCKQEFMIITYPGQGSLSLGKGGTVEEGDEDSKGSGGKTPPD